MYFPVNGSCKISEFKNTSIQMKTYNNTDHTIQPSLTRSEKNALGSLCAECRVL